MSELLLEQEGAVARVWLNRPELSNAFNDHLIASLTEMLQTLDADPAVRVVVLGGKGKHFCAGADLNWMRSMASYSEADNRDDAARLALLMRTLNDLSKPVIARCQGAAFGGGVGLLACCDMVVASADSIFCLSEVRLGLTPATISPFVIEAIGARQARRYFQTTERFSSARGLELGLVAEVVPEAELDTCIDGLIRHLLSGGPVAQKDAKQLIAAVSKSTDQQACTDMTIDMIARQRVSSEGQDGLSAFLNKQKPGWLS